MQLDERDRVRLEFAHWLKGERLKRRWTQTELARRAGGNTLPSMVSRWERGTQPEPGSCDLIANALGLDVDYVLQKAGHRPRQHVVTTGRAEELIGKVRRIDWNDQTKYATLSGILDGWLEDARRLLEEGAANSRPRSSSSN